ncbi:NAD-dependent succinate-semialdehyde dehydrogenase [Shinella pollutisoli]|uniref:NAD-dependent succinate-semialdehyde dehydrogenase n=1 Tax=Shinella pollutisoli TaxID=2250594 RepID=A0ABV7DIK3_9HYPH|nr:NAD-dependent succinate-semialdehyde dehydrogenase [Shinella pollutisoli]
MWNREYPDPQHFIAGAWQPGAAGDRHEIVDPASGEVIARLSGVSPAQVEEAIEAAGSAFHAWSAVPAWERAETLSRAATILRQRTDTIARWMTLEQGKPLAESRAEVHAAADVFVWAAEECKRTYGRLIPSRVKGVRQFTEFEPVGPSALFAPWNFPLILPTRKVATALAAGCTAVLKPAEQTPASAMALVLACLEAGVPAGALNLLTGDAPPISQALLQSRVIRKVSLTGSVAVGRQVARLAGEHLKKCTLELGGHAPVIILDDCDLEHAVATLVRTKFRNAGQVCVSPTRLLVQQGIARQFTERFVAAAARLAVGPGLDEATQMGPLATARRREAVDAMVRDAQAKGGRLLTGGVVPEGSGFFYPPTVIADTPVTASALRDEPFGPVALLSTFTDVDDAVAEANRLPLGLAAYLFTTDLKHARDLSAGIRSGMVGINHVAFGLPETPMCGVRDSGYGHEGGSEGIREYLVTKFVNEYC